MHKNQYMNIIEENMEEKENMLAEHLFCIFVTCKDVYLLHVKTLLTNLPCSVLFAFSAFAYLHNFGQIAILRHF